MPDKTYLVLPHLRILGANAMSSAYAAGFPAVTAFLGFTKALENTLGFVKMPKTGIVIHTADFQSVFQRSENCYCLKLKKSPVKPNGKSSSIIEDATIHMEITLLIECGHLRKEDEPRLQEALERLLPCMRFAGGEIYLSKIINNNPKFLIFRMPEGDEEQNQKSQRRILRQIMPGFALVSRLDLLQEIREKEQGDALSRLLTAISIHATPSTSQKDDSTKAKWIYKKNYNGWLIPLTVGFHDLSGPATVKGQRAYNREHHFAEPVLSLCEFKMPHRVVNDLDGFEPMMWHYEYDAAQGDYLCANPYCDNYIQNGD